MRILYYDSSITSKSASSRMEIYCSKLVQQLAALCNSPRGNCGGFTVEVAKTLAFTGSINENHSFFRSRALENQKFAQDGFRAYQELASQELEAQTNERYLATILQGLKKLPRLKEVVIASGSLHQSPFGRSWPLNYLAPNISGCINQEDSERVFSLKTGYDDSHKLLFQALSRSGKNIKRLITGSYNIPRESFNADLKPDLSINDKEDKLNVNSDLEALTLAIDDTSNKFDVPWRIGRLRSFLAEFPGIVELNLDFSHWNGINEGGVPIKTICKSCTCNQLRHLALSGCMMKGGGQLLEFLRRHTLQSFHMGRMGLVVPDSWVPTLAAIQISMPKIPHLIIHGPFVMMPRSNPGPTVTKRR